MPETLFEELKRYVGFTDADGEVLRRVGAGVAPGLERIAEVFYARILEHEGARRVVAGGEQMVGHLKFTLQQWMRQLFEGPWDEAYFARRARIGQAHVRIALPQHYVFGAMHVLRRELGAEVARAGGADAGPAALALQKLLDLELAIMLHTYREDLARQEARAERLSTLGQLAGSIGHELRNPLGVIETSTYILRSSSELTPTGKKHVDRIEAQVRLATEIVSKLLDMIRERPLAKEAIDLERLARDVAASVERPGNVRIDLRGLDRVPRVCGDPVQVRQVLTNLLQNAIDAVPEGGEVRVAGSASATGVTVEVEDSGAGVPPELEHRVFEPLVTTKPHGVGLGLALVKRIVERHGGRIELGRGELGGARFSVHFPAEELGA